MHFLFTKQLRDSGLPADVLVGKLNKDKSCALRRDTIAQETTVLDAAQRAVEDELALNEAGWDGSRQPPPLPPTIYDDALTRSYFLCQEPHG